MDKYPWATILIAIAFTIAAVAGAAVVIWGDPGTLSFDGYLDDLAKFAGAVGLLAVGRGIKSGLKNHGKGGH